MEETLSNTLNLNPNEKQAFINIAERKDVSKKHALIEPGRVIKKLFFLEKGALRAFRYVDGLDYTHFFFSDNWFVTDFKSYLTDLESELFIETITDSVYYEINKSELDTLIEEFPVLEKLMRIIAERAYLFAVDRLEGLQTKPLKQRYDELLEQNPELFLSFQQKHIASYLGVTEQSLSRIKQG